MNCGCLRKFICLWRYEKRQDLNIISFERRELVDDEHAQFINKKRKINDHKSIKYILEKREEM